MIRCLFGYPKAVKQRYKSTQRPVESVQTAF